jgi:signal transduction histidine kinase
VHSSFRFFTSSRATPTVIATIISVPIFVLLVIFVRNERQTELAEGQKRGVEETNRVASRVGLVIASLEQILLTVTRELEGRADGDISSYWTSREFQEKMRFSMAGFRIDLRASIFDASGILQAISVEHPAPYLNLADSEWFKSCIQHDGNGIRPVGALKTQFDGSYVLVFCSVIRGKAGAPIGIAVAALRKQLIDNLIKSADPYSDRNYVLVMKDGTVLSSVVGDQSLDSGRKIPQAQFLQKYNAARDGLWTTAPAPNQRLSTGRLVIASGMIQELPIIVGSSITSETIYKNSNEELVFIVPAVLALIVIIIVLGILISKYNAKNDALLAESQEALAIEAKAKQQAEVFAQEKNRFYSLVSHDIRTPLMAIQTATELLRLSKGSTANRSVINALAVSSAQSSSILESVLTVNSAEMPDVNMTSEAFSLRQLLLDIIETCRMASPSARIVFQSLDGPGFPELVFRRKNVLGQVILNIITNAIKYSGEKQITVSLTFPKIMSDDVSFRISIIDQGPGMEQALIETLFLPYERGENARAAKDDGLGLGLWIADVWWLASRAR